MSLDIDVGADVIFANVGSSDKVGDILEICDGINDGAIVRSPLGIFDGNGVRFSTVGFVVIDGSSLGIPEVISEGDSDLMCDGILEGFILAIFDGDPLGSNDSAEGNTLGKFDGIIDGDSVG